ARVLSVAGLLALLALLTLTLTLAVAAAPLRHRLGPLPLFGGGAAAGALLGRFAGPVASGGLVRRRPALGRLPALARVSPVAGHGHLVAVARSHFTRSRVGDRPDGEEVHRDDQQRPERVVRRPEEVRDRRDAGQGDTDDPGQHRAGEEEEP